MIKPEQWGGHREHPENTEAERDLTEVLGTLNHEFRTPLTAIKGYTATLLRSAQRMTAEERREFLEGIQQATDRLESLTTRVLDVAQVEAGILHLEMETVDIATLLQETLAVARQWVPITLRSQTSFHVYLKDADGHLVQTLPFVKGDMRRLRDVLLSLLENAVHFSPHGGKIEVVAHPVFPRQSFLPQGQSGEGQSFLEICLCDYGIGIPPEHLESIFDRFHRVDTRLTREVNGLGLGLTLCRHVIALHQGRIWAESCPAGGSAFHIWLPLAETMPAR